MEARNVETIFIHIDTFFGWTDRVRILFGRPAHTRVRQTVWQDANGVMRYDQATSSTYVDSIRPTIPPVGGYEALAEPEAASNRAG